MQAKKSKAKARPGVSIRSSKGRPVGTVTSLKVGDAKGRVFLGPDVARRPVQIEECGKGEWRIRLVEPIPVREAWLFKNPEALRSVQRGIEQAKNHKFAPDPREGQDYSWLDDVDAENV